MGAQLYAHLKTNIYSKKNFLRETLRDLQIGFGLEDQFVRVNVEVKNINLTLKLCEWSSCIFISAFVNLPHALRLLYFHKFYFVWTVREMCDEPE